MVDYVIIFWQFFLVNNKRNSQSIVLFLYMKCLKFFLTRTRRTKTCPENKGIWHEHHCYKIEQVNFFYIIQNVQCIVHTIIVNIMNDHKKISFVNIFTIRIKVKAETIMKQKETPMINSCLIEASSPAVFKIP